MDRVAGRHLVKREYLAPDWDEDREEVVAHERISLLGLTLSADRHGQLRTHRAGGVAADLRPRGPGLPAAAAAAGWLRANDALARRGAHTPRSGCARAICWSGAESLVEFYDRALPRQVSSTADAGTFQPASPRCPEAGHYADSGGRFTRALPDPRRWPNSRNACRSGVLTFDVEYRFAPGEAGDGATLRVPPAALPLYDRTALAAAIPGLAGPRVEALCVRCRRRRRRSLIPIGETAAAFSPTGGCRGRGGALAAWIQVAARRARRRSPLRSGCRTAASDAAGGGASGDRVLARGADLPELRRACASADGRGSG